MAKKDKKKGKKQAGDWSDDEPASPATPPVASAKAGSDAEEEDRPAAAASRFANFSSFVDDNAGDDEEEDGGGLMATIRSTESKKKAKKDKKKANKGAVDDEDEEDILNGDEIAEDVQASKAPIQMTADELMDEEFGPVKAKGKAKKAKKGKTQYQPGMDDDEEFLNEQIKSLSVKEPEHQQAGAAEKASAPEESAKEESKDASARAATSAQGDDAAEAEDDGENKSGVLSKKEKERLKKEKEKAKKKAQAAAKKATSGSNAQQDEAEDKTPAAPDAKKAEPGAEAEEGEEEEGGATSASKNKKKKKKAAAKAEEPAAAAKPAAGKKVPAHIAALQAAMAKQKADQEEARRREEEERRAIEEEDARLAEIERQKEEEKRRKKEKEKAKIDQLKKEGKYMTPKQKADAAAAKARRDAMIASGQIKVEGLEADEEAAAAPKIKKPSYSKKKPQAKKAGTGGLAVPDIITSGSGTPPAAPESPVVGEPSIPSDPTRAAEHEPTDIKDDWEVQSDTETKPEVAAPVEEEDLDDWDAESGSDKEDTKRVETKPIETKSARPVSKTSAKAPAQVSKKAEEVKKAQPNGTAAKAAQAPVKAKATPSTSKTQEEPESDEDESEHESDDSESDDSDSDDSDSDDDSNSDSDSEEERISAAKRQAAERKAAAAARREQKREEAIAAGSKDDLRSPICCILGHVDTGKTKLLDKIRQTNVQEGEAGGITQQIGATYFPREIIQAKTAPLGEANIKEYKLPGLLVIDTPGHESFTNLRTRGSSLCNIAILVVDIMHGLEPQTLESIRLLRTGKTPFIVALNKIDRLYGWQATPDGAFRDSLAKQSKAVQNEFERRLGEAKVAFAEQGLNAIPYYENTNYAKNVSIVPTSAHTGEGIPDMLMLITKLTQERMSSQLMYITELECTVLEVKVIEGLGTTLDVILINGVLHEGDRIVVCGLNGPIVTQVRALLTPQPLKELRVKGQYVHHSMIKAAMGIKIVAPDLEKAIAGSRLLVVGPDDDEDDLKEAVMEDLQSLASSVDKSGRGVYVQASTLGSLEALLEFLKQSKIPVSNINIGPVHKKDVTRAAAMLDKAPELAVILAFDVPVDKDAERLADENNIKIFKADIIYHLFDDFTKHNAAILEAKRKDAAPTAVWPCRLRILRCFAKREPIILGCDIIEGATLRVGTPLAVVKVDPETKKKTIIKLGKVTSLEINHKAMDVVKKSQVGAGVAVKIEHAVYESAKLFGRHFTEHDELVSLITRQSIDALKEHFKDQVDKDDWQLIAKKLKPLLDVA